MIENFVMIFAEDLEHLVWQEARIEVSKISATYHAYGALLFLGSLYIVAISDVIIFCYVLF